MTVHRIMKIFLIQDIQNKSTEDLVLLLESISKEYSGISFEWNNLNEDELIKISKAFQKLPKHIIHVSFENCKLNTVKIGVLAAFFKNLSTQITSLSLKCNDLFDHIESFEKLFEAFSRKLENLNLSDNDMSNEFSRYYWSTYKKGNGSFIKSLLKTADIFHLSKTPQYKTPNFTDAFAKLPNLKELDLSFCGLQTYFDTNKLFKHISSMNLKKLSFMGCYLYLEPFDTTIPFPSSLEELNIAECRLGYMEVKRAKNWLKNLPNSLRELNFGSNAFGSMSGSGIHWNNKDIHSVIKVLPSQLEVFRYWDRGGNNIFKTNGYENLKVLPPKLKEIYISSSELVDSDQPKTDVCNQLINCFKLLPCTTQKVRMDSRSSKFIQEFIASKLFEIPENIKFIYFHDKKIDVLEEKALYLCKIVQNLISKELLLEKFDFTSLNEIFKFDEVFTNQIIEKLTKQKTPVASFSAGLLYYGQIENECYEAQPNTLKACECFIEAFHASDSTLKKMAKFYLWEIKTTNNYRFFNQIQLQPTLETYSSLFVDTKKRGSYPPSQDYDIPRKLTPDI